MKVLKWLKRWWAQRERLRPIDDIVRTMIAHEDPAYRKSIRDMSKEEMDARCAEIEKRQKELQNELDAVRAETQKYRAEAAEHRAEARCLRRSQS